MTRTSSLKSVGAVGGDEAALFAGDLLTMYQKYVEAQGWRFEVMEASMNGKQWFQRSDLPWFQVSQYTLSLSTSLVPTASNVSL